MDQNEMIQQLANNPQMLAQLLQTIQQNGMIPPGQPPQTPPRNWNMPTSPMAEVWWNNMMNMCNQNNQAQQQNVPNNNQPQQQNIQNEQKLEDDALSISIVKSPDDIRIDQIPMNDKISLFMKDDMSVIYGKRWTNNGTIDDLRFVLEKQPQQDNTNSSNNSAAVNNQPPFNFDELMTAVGNIVNQKLEEFKKNYLDDNGYNQSKNNGNNGNNKNNRKG